MSDLSLEDKQPVMIQFMVCIVSHLMGQDSAFPSVNIEPNIIAIIILFFRTL